MVLNDPAEDLCEMGVQIGLDLLTEILLLSQLCFDGVQCLNCFVA